MNCFLKFSERKFQGNLLCRHKGFPWNFGKAFQLLDILFLAAGSFSHIIKAQNSRFQAPSKFVLIIIHYFMLNVS